MHFFMPGLLLMYYLVISASSHDNSNQVTTEPVLIPIKDQLYGEGNVNRQEFKRTPLDEVFHQFQAKRHQTKRSTGDSPRSRWSDLNDDHRYALIEYSGIINSEVIYVLTFDLDSDEQVISSDLHRSDDYGDSFDKISSRISYATLLPSIHVNPSDHNQVFFIDSTSAKLYLSENEGASLFTTVYLYPATIDQSSIVVHPTEGDWLIARDSINNALYVSRDLGETAFTKIADVTDSDDFQWGDSSYDFDNSVVYFTSSNVLYTQKFPYNEKKQFSPSFTGIVTGFLLLDRYIVVVDNYNKLWVSADRRPLQQAVLLSNYDHTQYHVSSINSMQVLVLAQNSTNQYNMYLSDEHGVYYYLSLTNLVAESRTVQSYSLGPTIIDLVTLASTNYTTYIANQWVSGSYKRTLISFDAGVNWHTITDNETDCIDQSSCSLHFHIYTNKYWRAGIYSSESAPGIAIAHGTLLGGGDEGYRDGDSSDLYITRDGGVTWTKTLSGTWLVNVLDHGSLLVAAHDHYSDTYTSRTLMYSCNEGQSWSYYRFTTQPVSIFGVITEPGETTTVVSLYGTPDKAGPREWSVFVVEFKNIFTHTCQSNDYYEWIPTDEHSNDTGCFLGVSVVVERRKPDVCCYNSHTYIRVVDYSTCHCTREDYECDYGYKHANGYNGLCIRDDTILSTSSTSCVEGESYQLISRGYRKIGGNGCSGGAIEDTFQHVNITCCSTEDGSSSSVRTNKEQLYKYSLIAACAVLLILLLIIICLLCAMKCNRNRYHKPATSNSSNTQQQLELSDHIGRPYEEVVPVLHNSSYAMDDNVVPHKDTKIAPSVLPDYSKIENYSYPYPMPQKKDMAEEKGIREKEMMRCWRHPMEEEIIEKFDETEDSHHYY